MAGLGEHVINSQIDLEKFLICIFPVIQSVILHQILKGVSSPIWLLRTSLTVLILQNRKIII